MTSISALKNQETTKQTNWTVITGAPCSGKTTLVNELGKRLQCNTIPDASRAYIEERMHEGLDMLAIRANPIVFLQNIFDLKVQAAKSTPVSNFTLFDYAIPDHIAYANHLGVAVNADYYRASYLYRFKHVFILDPLPFAKDDVRSEDSVSQRQLDALIEEAYRTVGYQPIRVPVASTDTRIAFVESYKIDE